MIKSFIFKGDYQHLNYKALKINDTSEHIVWIYQNNLFYYRCYGLPQTIVFCEKILFMLNKHGELSKLTLGSLNNKEKLILHHLASFHKEYK